MQVAPCSKARPGRPVSGCLPHAQRLCLQTDSPCPGGHQSLGLAPPPLQSACGSGRLQRWRWMGATSRRLSVPAQDLPSAVRSTASSRSPHETKLVLYARDSSSESMRALLATIKVPAGWAGAGGGERGEGHQAGQESSLLGRRRRWHGPRAAAPLPRRLGVGRSGPSQLLATRAVGTRRARSWPVTGGKPGRSNRPHSRGSAGGGLGGGGWRRRGLGRPWAWSRKGYKSIACE